MVAGRHAGSSSSQTATYPSYGVTMKQVCVNSRDLLGDPAVDHGRALLPTDGHRDPGAEVDQRVAVDVDDHAAARGGDEDRQDVAEPAGHAGLTALQQLP